jgi:hypothetical protein
MTPTTKPIKKRARHHNHPVDISLEDQPEPAPTAAFKKFCLSGHPLDQPNFEERTRPWYLVLWLTGVDYFLAASAKPSASPLR